jgi:hypothetical protein
MRSLLLLLAVVGGLLANPSLAFGETWAECGADHPADRLPSLRAGAGLLGAQSVLRRVTNFERLRGRERNTTAVNFLRGSPARADEPSMTSSRLLSKLGNAKWVREIGEAEAASPSLNSSRS